MSDGSLLRAVAFYLPQYHPIAENNEWWGKGFTEWTNVTKAAPLFPGHYQPHLPSDLGFYDLRLAEVRAAQAALAREHGIHGFCYYHYWFNGRRILERPFNEILASGQPDFPFCLCWANENWTRRWDGQDREVLLGQNYGEEDDRAHVRSLAATFADKRYIRIGNRPVFLIYKASFMPDAAKTVAMWRKTAREEGIGELYLCNVEAEGKEHGHSARWGFDAAVEFAPDWRNMPPRQRQGLPWRILRRLGLSSPAYGDHSIYEYDEVVAKMLAKPAAPYLRYRCVTPSWDNAARRKNGANILRGATPQKYQQWLSTVVNSFQPPSADENLLFINAWNEWAEGNHLEPCQKWGRAYLESTRQALQGK